MESSTTLAKAFWLGDRKENLSSQRGTQRLLLLLLLSSLLLWLTTPKFSISATSSSYLSTPHRALKSGGEKTLSIIVVLLAGLGAVLVFVALTYIVTILLDRYCGIMGLVQNDNDIEQGRGRGRGDGDPQSHDAFQTRTPRKVMWATLTLEERSNILRLILDKNTRQFYTPAGEKTLELNAVSESRLATAPPPPLVNLQSNESSTTSAACDPIATSIEASRNPTTGSELLDLTLTQGMPPCVGDDHERMCSICLVEYENGNVLTKGTQCAHWFHRDCCVAWLLTKQRNEEHAYRCPYCRQSMFTGEELDAAMYSVTGFQKVPTLLPVLAESTFRESQVPQSSEIQGSTDQSTRSDDRSVEMTEFASGAPAVVNESSRTVGSREPVVVRRQDLVDRL